jgi:hypothetical protein
LRQQRTQRAPAGDEATTVAIEVKPVGPGFLFIAQAIQRAGRDAGAVESDFIDVDFAARHRPLRREPVAWGTARRFRGVLAHPLSPVGRVRRAEPASRHLGKHVPAEKSCRTSVRDVKVGRAGAAMRLSCGSSANNKTTPPQDGGFLLLTAEVAIWLALPRGIEPLFQP